MNKQQYSIKQQIRWVSGACLLLFTGLSFLIMRQSELIQQIDQVFLDYRLPNIPSITLFYSTFSKLATIGPVFLTITILAGYLWWSGNRRLGLWCIFNLVLVSASGQFFKQLFQRSRPDVVQYISRDSMSFPSGHSLLIMTLFCIFLLVVRVTGWKNWRRLVIFWGILVIVIGFGRIYLGVHYLSDVLAGFLLSAGISCGSFALIYQPLLEGNSINRQGKKYKKFTIWQKIVVTMLSFLLIISAGGTFFLLSLYQSSRKVVETMHQPIENLTVREESEPISILLLGIANDDKRKTDYRANAIMVATLNSQKEQSTIVSIPRDSFVEIIDEENFYDKINHAHAFGGAEMMIQTVENFLDIPIHHFVSIDMDGLESLVDAVGGVTVNNQFEFTAEGIHYPIGAQHLNGWEALQYTRMRYDDPEGDYGRQKRQREVTELLGEKLLTVNSVFGYQKIMDAIGENGKTDLTFDQMQDILLNNFSAFKNIENYQMQGDGFTGDGYTGEYGISYQRVEPEEVTRISELLKEQLNLLEE